MKDLTHKALIQINAIQQLKKLQMFNPTTAQMVLNDPIALMKKLEQMNEVAAMFKSPFEMPDGSIDGLIKFMKTENNIPVGLDSLDCHVLIAGQTGCGKSTLLKVIFSQILFLALHKVPFLTWLFVKAQDMRPLLKINKNVITVRFKEIKLNPLEPPPGIKYREWASIIADIWTQIFYLQSASKALLIECLSELYEKFSKHGYYPNLFDLYDYVKGLKFSGFSRMARYQESISNRLAGQLYGTMGEVFNCSKGHINLLKDRNVIFELLYLTSEQQLFLVNYLLSYLFNYKLINELPTRHFSGIDDGNLIFDSSYEKRPDLGLPIIHHLLTTVRKSKINIFACTQTPHQVGASIHSNSFAKIMFSLSNGKDIDFMQQSMGIKDQEEKAYCHNIPPREAVVKFSARYQKPFIARVPEFNLGDEFIPDEFIVSNNARLLSGFKVQPRFESTCAKTEIHAGGKNQPPVPEIKTGTKKTDQAMTVLLDIFSRFDVSSTQRAKDLGMSAQVSNKIYKHLEKEELVEAIHLNLTGKRGGLSKFHMITKKGCELIDKKPGKQSGGTGSMHHFIQIFCKKHLPEKGFKELVIEKNFGGKRIDLFGKYNGLNVGIEVCCSTIKTEHINVQKDLDKCDVLIIATPDKKTKDKLDKKLNKKIDENEKVKTCVVHELLNDPEKLIKSGRQLSLTMGTN